VQKQHTSFSVESDGEIFKMDCSQSNSPAMST